MLSMGRNPSQNDTEKTITTALKVLDQEIAALSELREGLEVNELIQAFEKIIECQGMTMVVGSGTSSSIARRLAHVLTCSGAPAVYLDPGQAQHGYSGIISAKDVLIAFSRGGETKEINHVLRIAKKRGAGVIGIMENTQSTMALLSDIILSGPISPENDAVDVIPLASTLVHAAIGDILCAAVLSVRGFEDHEFAELHPGGAVGKRLDPQNQSIESVKLDYSELRTLEGLVLDMDGVLWHGVKPMPGLQDFFEVLNERGMRYVFATNNPSQRPEGFAAKAAQFGLTVDPQDVITSVTATLHYLKKSYPPGTRIHVIGQPPMKDQIEEAGFILADDDVVAVVAALDRAMTYETIKRGTLLIRAGAELLGTNPDPSYPSEEGHVPGSGMMVTALAASANRTPTIMGKPERIIFDIAIERLGVDARNIASVGDRLETDIAGGMRAGLKTILLFSGIASPEDLSTSSIQPTWVFQDISELAQILSSFEEVSP
jgi:4-nitrophenyl phosphatase